MRRRSVWLSTVIVLAGAGALAGQAEEEMIPRELALALVAGNSMESGVLRVGVAADGLPGVFVPENGALLGSYGGPGRGVTVINLFETPEVVRVALEQRVTRAGWSPPQRPNMGGGFVPSTVLGATSIFCLGDTVVTYAAFSRQGARGTLLRITHYTASQASPCMQSSVIQGSLRVSQPTRLQPPPLPTLIPPAGVSLRQMSAGGGIDNRSSSARLSGAANGEDLLAHFEGQLREQGWSSRTAATGQQLAITRWEKTTDDKAWFAYLTLVPVTEGQWQAEITVVAVVGRQ